MDPLAALPRQLRLLGASVVLAIPAVVFALNSWISLRERGFVEPLDLPAALAFAAVALVVLRGSRLALLLGIAFAVGYLVTAAVGGVIPFVVYWVLALIVALQALPVTELRARSVS